MLEVWEAHTRQEFEAHDVEATLTTMTKNPHVHNVSVMVGGVGLKGVRDFYSNTFVHALPSDTETTLISRTIGEEQIVDELIFKFTHTIEMPWMLPNIKPTGKRVEVPLVAIIKFEHDKVAHEHIYWDQATVLTQLGFLDSSKLPVKGVECARTLLKLAGL